MPKYTLEVLPYELSIMKVDYDKSLLSRIADSNFYTITKTDKEYSIVAESDFFTDIQKDIKVWKAFRFADTLDFSLTGILAKISNILAESHISIFAISTYDTDYVLVGNEDYESAINKLRDYYNITIL